MASGRARPVRSAASPAPGHGTPVMFSITHARASRPRPQARSAPRERRSRSPPRGRPAASVRRRASDGAAAAQMRAIGGSRTCSMITSSRSAAMPCTQRASIGAHRCPAVPARSPRPRQQHRTGSARVAVSANGALELPLSASRMPQQRIGREPANSRGRILDGDPSRSSPGPRLARREVRRPGRYLIDAKPSSAATRSASNEVQLGVLARGVRPRIRSSRISSPPEKRRARDPPMPWRRPGRSENRSGQGQCRTPLGNGPLGRRPRAKPMMPSRDGPTSGPKVGAASIRLTAILRSSRAPSC